MEKVYIIEECVGMYECSVSTPFKAYTSYDKAKAECDTLNKEMDKIRYSFDKLENEEVVEKNINKVKECIFKQARPSLFDKWYRITHCDKNCPSDRECVEIENEYYNVTDDAAENVTAFIDRAKEMNEFSENELREMEIYLTYVDKCYMKSIGEGLPSYYLSDNAVELVD